MYVSTPDFYPRSFKATTKENTVLPACKYSISYLSIISPRIPRQNSRTERMAEPTSAQATSPPPSRPASPNVPPRDERNDEVAGDESAPLLQSEEGTRTVRFASAKFVHFLTSLAMSSAVLALALIIVTKIVGSVVPGGTDIPWDTSDAMSAAVVTVRSYHSNHPLSITHCCTRLCFLFSYVPLT